jgi:hypothetical protein
VTVRASTTSSPGRATPTTASTTWSSPTPAATATRAPSSRPPGTFVAGPRAPSSAQGTSRRSPRERSGTRIPGAP